MLGQGTSYSTGLLWSEVKRFKLLGFVELAQVLTLGLANNSQHSSNGFSNKFSEKNRCVCLGLIQSKQQHSRPK